MKQHLQRGFTLIELMIVVAIVGILAAVALPSYQDYLVRARISEVILATAPMKLAVQEYFAATGRLPVEGEASTIETAISNFTAGMPSQSTSRYADGLGGLWIDPTTSSFILMIRMSDEVGAKGQVGNPALPSHFLTLTASRSADGRTLVWQCDGTPRSSQMPSSCQGPTGSDPVPFNPLIPR